MKKIWIVESKWHKRTFKTEKTFLDFIHSIKNSKLHRNYKVSIYGILEEHDSSDKYLDSFLTQKERDEQLSSLIDGNPEIITLQKINFMITQFIEINSEIDSSKKHLSLKNYLKQSRLSELSIESFKKIISSDPRIRKALLYDGPDSIEWYQTLLSIHRFKFEKEYMNGRTLVKTPESRLQNFNEAKKLANHVRS